MKLSELTERFRDRPFFETRHVVAMFDEPKPQVQARLSRWVAERGAKSTSSSLPSQSLGLESRWPRSIARRVGRFRHVSLRRHRADLAGRPAGGSRRVGRLGGDPGGASGTRGRSGYDMTAPASLNLLCMEALASVPVVCAALGPVAGFPAARLAASHLSIMTKRTAQVLIGGPALVERALGWVEERGVERCEVRVASLNAEGQAFWRSIGFGDLMDVLHRRL